MCGIIGCFSREGCYEKLMEGLARLEYRGYDSAGVALLSEGGIAVRKRCGGVNALAGPPLAGQTGIGHTRWATHGRPSDANAHPHIAGKFALVHNGIVENHAALRRELEGQGAVFASETDSEVIVQLIARLYRGDFFAAVSAAWARLQGSFALAGLCGGRPGEIVCARRKSPLGAAAGGGALFVCSDVPALAGLAEYVCPAADGEFVRIAGGRVFFCDGQGKEIAKVFSRLPEGSRAETGGGTFMEREVAAVPRALADTLAGLRGLDFAPCARALRAAKRVFAVACGTAYHAALAFKDAAEREADVTVLCHTSSAFRDRAPRIGQGDLVVAVSQSGETADTLEAARLAKSGGAYLLSVTNAPHSSLAALADFGIAMRAGAEVAVAATKSYNCQLLCLYALAAQLAFFRHARFPAWYRSLGALVPAAREAFSAFPAVQALAARLAGAKGMYFIGRGQDAVTAAEGALKVREIAYRFAESCPAGELKHGTLALVEEGFPVLALATERTLAQKCENALAEVKARGGYAVLFSQYEEVLSASCADAAIRLPAVPEPLMPAVAVIPLQELACSLCLLSGYDPDRPRNLAKSVTVE